MEDEETLNITPSFKSRSSKGKGKARSRQIQHDGDNDSSSNLGISTNGNTSHTVSSSSSIADANATTAPALTEGDGADNDEEEEGNTSSVIFNKRSAKSNRNRSILGGATSSTATSSPSSSSSASGSVVKRTSASSATGAPSTSSLARSRLNISFGANDMQIDEDNDGSSNNEDDRIRMMSANEMQSDDADTSISEVRKRSIKKRASGLRGGIGSSSLGKAAEKALSSSLSQASISSLAGRASTTTPGAPSYSRDYLDELKAANMSAPRTVRASSPSSALANYGDEDTPDKAGDSALSRYSTSGMVEDDDNDEFVTSVHSTLVPTEDTIMDAKTQRENARRLGLDHIPGSNAESRGSSGQDDYISLTVGMPTSKRESRLVREEDEIGEGDDAYAAYTGAQERIALGKKGRKEMEKRRKAEMRALIEGGQGGEDDDGLGGGDGTIGMPKDDEEEREWEMAQIRRGGRRGRLGGADDGNDDGEPHRSAPIPDTVPIPTLAGTSKRLKSALEELQQAKTDDEELLEKSEHELASLSAQEADIKLQVESINNKFEFFIEFKAYIQDVAAFLEAKYPLLDKMESDNSAFQRERTKEIVRKRRLLDDADDLALFTGVGIKVELEQKRKIDKGKGRGSDNDDMEIEDSEEQGRGGDHDDGDVDDMGRSRRDDDTAPRSLARRTRRQERAKRKANALHSLSSNPTSNTAIEELERSYTTDDDLLSSDAQDLRAAGETLFELRENIFADVESAEFRDPNLGIKVKFLEWKSRYPEDYRDAFAGLSLVQAWEFWTRVEMASWNPFGIKELPTSPASLDAYNWYSSLTSYQHEAEAIGSSINGAASIVPTEEDSVVNGMVATVILPRLRKLALDAYDPYSRSMTSKALHVVEEISYCVEIMNQRFTYLILGFLSCFQNAIADTQRLLQQAGDALQSPEVAIDMEAIQARNRFLERSLKLLNNANRWRRYARNVVHLAAAEGSDINGVSVGSQMPFEECLAKELVGKCMLPVIEAAWDTGGRDVANKVLTLFPNDAGLHPDVAMRLRGQ